MWVPPKIFGFPLVVAEKQTAPGMRTSAINLIHVRLKICRDWQSQTDLLLVYFFGWATEVREVGHYTNCAVPFSLNWV